MMDELHDNECPKNQTTDLVSNAVLSPTFQLEFGRTAMACQFEVILNAGRPTDGGDHAMSALNEIQHLEQLLSVYIDTSEFSLLNRTASQSAQTVSEPVFELLEIAKWIHRETAGAFDISAASLTDVWGFSRRQGRMPNPQEIALSLQRIGSEHILLNAETRSVQFDRVGLKINSGGIGKGYALDRASDILRRGGVTDFLIHGGKSSIRAAGDRHDDRLLNKDPKDFEGGWRVAVKHPLQSQFLLGELCLRNQALGTSGPANQFFYFQGKRYGHIIDPRTGWPADGILSITVLAPTAAQADALATGLYVLGVDAATEFCNQNPDISMLAILPGKRHGEVELVACNLSKQTWFPVNTSASR